MMLAGNSDEGVVMVVKMGWGKKCDRGEAAIALGKEEQDDKNVRIKLP